MTLINFTVNFDVLAVQADSDDGNLDSDISALTGVVTFTPVLGDQRPVLAADYQPRPAGFKLLPVQGVIDTDGRLKRAKSSDVGVRLPANDPVLELDTLVYRVDFALTTLLGEPVRVDGGFFAAPDEDTTVNLAVVLETVASAAFGAPRLSGGEFNLDGDIVFTSADGSTLSPIEIPEGVLVFTDNGDSTWSVGI